MKNNYDIIIVGGGPAGMAAGIYASRAGRSVLIIESDVIGGQASESYEIENYPGFENIAGPDLMKKMFEQTKKLGVEFFVFYGYGYLARQRANISYLFERNDYL